MNDKPRTIPRIGDVVETTDGYKDIVAESGDTPPQLWRCQLVKQTLDVKRILEQLGIADKQFVECKLSQRVSIVV